MKKLGLSLLLVLLLTVSVSYVFAITLYSYDVSVPKFGGTGYTENKTKTAVGVYFATGTHGGGYKLWARLENANYGGLSEWMTFPSGSSFTAPNT